MAGAAIKIGGILLIVLMLAGVLVGVLGLFGGKQGNDSGGANSVELDTEGVTVYIDNTTELFDGIPLVAMGPRDSDKVIYIFYDVWCPYCAKEFSESGDLFLDYAKNGVKIVFVDFLVHEQALDLHAALRCIAEDGGPYYEILVDLYKIYEETGKTPTMQDLQNLLDKYNVKLDGNCTDKWKDEIAASTSISYYRYGIQGTPTIVVTAPGLDQPSGIPGYVEREQLKTYLDKLLAGDTNLD